MCVFLNCETGSNGCLQAVGGTRADHDKNYNTHVRSHWLKADFMGNEALVTVFFYQDSDSHHRKRPHFTFGGCSIASMTSSLSFGLNTWSRKNVQLWTNETRTFLSCTISRLLKAIYFNFDLTKRIVPRNWRRFLHWNYYWFMTLGRVQTTWIEFWAILTPSSLPFSFVHVIYTS